MSLPFSPEKIGIAVGIFALSTLATMGIVAAFLVLIDADHFVTEDPGVRAKITSPVLRGLWLVGKNLLGLLLIVAGLFLSLPGVPGQGLLTIFVGVLLLDIPGKRKFERRVVRRPRIRQAIDRLRARYDRAPLELERDFESDRGSGADPDGDTP